MNRKRFFAVSILGAALLLGGCPKGAYHDAVVAEHSFTTSLNSFQQAEQTEFQAGRIDAGEHQKIEAGIGKAAQAAQVLVASLQSGAANSTVQQNFQTVISAVGDLLNNGVLGIKNAQSQATLAAALKVAQAVLNNVSSLINTSTAARITPPVAPTKGGR